MRCVICKTGEVQLTTVQAEVKVGCDRLLVPVEAGVRPECGEPCDSTEALRYLERVREDFARKIITPASVGKVHQVSGASAVDTRVFTCALDTCPTGSALRAFEARFPLLVVRAVDRVATISPLRCAFPPALVTLR